jgi:hypothetical protein
MIRRDICRTTLSVGVFTAAVAFAGTVRADAWTSGTGTIFSGSSTKVGVGNSAPGAELDVSANTSGRGALRVNQLQSNANIADFQKTGTSEVTVTSTGLLQCVNGFTSSTTATNGTAITGTVTGAGTGARGVFGTSLNGAGVSGTTTGTPGASPAAGVMGTSSNGYGVYGITTWESTNGAAVYGYTATQGANAISGVQAGNDSGTAIIGQNTDLAGNLVATGETIVGIGGGIGVSGKGMNVGVYGQPRNVNAVAGVWGSVDPACGSATTCAAVRGDATAGYGVSASSSTNAAVYAVSGTNNAVLGINSVTDTSAAAISAVPGSTSGLAYWGAGGIQLTGGFAEKAGGGSWTAPSDKRIKKDVKDLELGLDELRRVHPVRFKYNGLGGTEDNGKEYVGVIAQELEQVLPSMVSTRDAKLHKGDAQNTKIELVDPSNFTYLLINAVKQQQKIIEKQDARIAALEQRQFPLASSLFSSGRLALAMGLMVLPVGLIVTRKRRKDGGSHAA